MYMCIQTCGLSFLIDQFYFDVSVNIYYIYIYIIYIKRTFKTISKPSPYDRMINYLFLPVFQQRIFPSAYQYFPPKCRNVLSTDMLIKVCLAFSLLIRVNLLHTYSGKEVNNVNIKKTSKTYMLSHISSYVLDYEE